MRARRGETKQERAARKASPDYPASTADRAVRAKFDASRYIPTGKHRTVRVGNW